MLFRSAVVGVRESLAIGSAVLELVVLVVAGIVVYTALVLGLERYSGYDSVALCRRMVETVVA